MAAYFPLERCLHGLNSLVKSLFGATFYDVPLSPGESWHPSVIKLSLHHPDEVLFLSFFRISCDYNSLNSILVMFI